MRKLFYLLIAMLVLVSCGNGSKKKTGENQAEEIQSNRVEVLYFHGADRKSTRLNSSHTDSSRMPSSA